MHTQYIHTPTVHCTFPLYRHTLHTLHMHRRLCTTRSCMHAHTHAYTHVRTYRHNTGLCTGQLTCNNVLYATLLTSITVSHLNQPSNNSLCSFLSAFFCAFNSCSIALFNSHCSLSSPDRQHGGSDILPITTQHQPISPVTYNKLFITCIFTQ